MIKPNEAHIWWARTDSPEWDLSNLTSLLSGDEKKRADRFRFPIHRRRFIIAHGWLRFMLGQYLNVSPDSLKFLQDPKGKPYLVAMNTEPGLHFSLSHSHDAALIGILLNRRIGVDIEHIRPLPNMESIADRYFLKSEMNSILNSPANERNRIFFHYWTMKEAYLKATGMGLAGLQSIQMVNGHTDKKIQNAFITDTSKKIWSIQSVHTTPGYAAALALEGNGSMIPFLREFSSRPLK
jgi:4'-phosphopantetheinyl transferase